MSDFVKLTDGTDKKMLDKRRNHYSGWKPV